MSASSKTSEESSMPFAPIAHVGLRDSGQDDGGSIPLRRLLAGAFRCRWLIVSLTFLCGLGASIFAVSQPNEYQSLATLLVKRGGEDVAVGPFSGEFTSVNAIQASNATHVLLSTDLCRRVANRVGAEKILAPYLPEVDPSDDSVIGEIRAFIYRVQRYLNKRSKPATIEGAVRRLSARLLVAAPNNARVIRVGYTANDPAAAQEVLRAYIDEAIRMHLEIYSDEAGIKLIEDSYSRAKSAHESAVTSLQAFLSDLSVVAFERELTRRQAAFWQATSDFEALDRTVETQKQLVKKLRQEVDGQEPKTETTELVVQQNPLIASLQARIDERNSQLVDLRARYPETDQSVVNAVKALADLEEQLAAEKKKPDVKVPQTRIVDNQQYVIMKARLAETKLQLVVDVEQLSRLEKRVVPARDALRELTRNESRHAELRDAVAAAETRLRQAESGYQLAQNKRLLTDSKLSSLVVAEHATLPDRPSGKSRMQLVVGGVAVGLFLSFLIALVVTMLDRTVRTADELESIGIAPVLAQIPQLTRRNLARHRILAPLE